MPAAPIKLLIADDHAALRRTVRQLFEGEAVTISEAATGEEAVKIFSAEHPDWVAMDMRMPGMGGVKATEAIRKIDPAARVIVISQFTEAEFREQALRAGAVAFVDKENISQLVELIRSHSPGN